MDWKTHHRAIKSLSWMILLGCASFSYFLMSPSRTLGVILGGLVVIANFNIMQHIVSRAFSAGGNLKTAKVSIIAKYYLRLLALGIILLILIALGGVDPIGLAIGLSTVFLSIVVFGIHMALKSKTREAI